MESEISMKIKMIDRCGDFRQHVLECSLQEIEAVLGPANCLDDTDKVKYSWGFEVDGVRCGIWDYYRSYKYDSWSVFGPASVIEQLFPGKAVA